MPKWAQIMHVACHQTSSLSSLPFYMKIGQMLPNNLNLPTALCDCLSVDTAAVDWRPWILSVNIIFSGYQITQSQTHWYETTLHHIQSSHGFKTALETLLYKQYQKWFQILSSFLPPPPPPPPIILITFLAECPCWCDVQGIQYYDWRIYFWGFNVYIFVDLVKGSVLTLVGEMQCYKFRMAEVNHTSLPVSKKLQLDGSCRELQL